MHLHQSTHRRVMHTEMLGNLCHCMLPGQVRQRALGSSLSLSILPRLKKQSPPMHANKRAIDTDPIDPLVALLVVWPSWTRGYHVECDNERPDPIVALLCDPIVVRAFLLEDVRGCWGLVLL